VGSSKVTVKFMCKFWRDNTRDQYTGRVCWKPNGLPEPVTAKVAAASNLCADVARVFAGPRGGSASGQRETKLRCEHDTIRGS